MKEKYRTVHYRPPVELAITEIQKQLISEVEGAVRVSKS